MSQDPEGRPKRDDKALSQHCQMLRQEWNQETKNQWGMLQLSVLRGEVLPARTRKQPWRLAWHFRWEVELRWLEMGCDRIVKQVERVGQAQVQSHETALTAAPAQPMTTQVDTRTTHFSGRANPRAGCVEQECIAFSSRACLHRQVYTSWFESVCMCVWKRRLHSAWFGHLGRNLSSSASRAVWIAPVTVPFSLKLFVVRTPMPSVYLKKKKKKTE